MYPRLKLLQKLLADDGAIFISIDDSEIASLRFLCDEIFGATNYVSTIAWLTGEYIYPPVGRCWAFGQDLMLSIMREWSDYELLPLSDFDERQKICGAITSGVPQSISAIVLAHPFDEIKDASRFFGEFIICHYNFQGMELISRV
jgi:hypothetical protein